jgi:hypothetical protein
MNKLLWFALGLGTGAVGMHLTMKRGGHGGGMQTSMPTAAPVPVQTPMVTIQTPAGPRTVPAASAASTQAAGRRSPFLPAGLPEMVQRTQRSSSPATPNTLSARADAASRELDLAIQRIPGMAGWH